MGTTKIEWLNGGKVWNPITGCSPVSEGCQNCYARRMANRLKGRYGYPKDEPFKVTFHPDRLEEPLHWKKPSRIFVCSMGDLFHDSVPEPFIIKIFAIMESAFQHTFLILTKRPERANGLLSHPDFPAYVRKFGYDWLGTKKYVERGPHWRNNVWFGISIENQKTADERIPILLQIPAEKRFVSVEPMLEEIDLTNIDGNDILGPATDNFWNKMPIRPAHLDWVICGGETGPGARPLHPDWVRSLRDQCQSAGVPFFFKQWGNSTLFLSGQQGVYKPNKSFGHLLDGKEWREWPKWR